MEYIYDGHTYASSLTRHSTRLKFVQNFDIHDNHLHANWTDESIKIIETDTFSSHISHIHMIPSMLLCIRLTSSPSETNRRHHIYVDHKPKHTIKVTKPPQEEKEKASTKRKEEKKKLDKQKQKERENDKKRIEKKTNHPLRSNFNSTFLFPASAKTCCQIPTHCCWRYDKAFCGLRNVPARMSRMRELRSFSASMDFQSRTEKRILLASMEMTPGYIWGRCR